MYKFICMCMYRYILCYIYIYIYVCVYIYIYTYICMYMYMYMCRPCRHGGLWGLATAGAQACHPEILTSWPVRKLRISKPRVSESKFPGSCLWT